MEILEVFRRDSPFGAFLDVQLVPPPAMLWQLMVRETNVEGAKGSEMWFVVNGVPIRYSLMEFSLITGLKCSQLAPGYEEQYDKDSLPVFVKENWSKGVKDAPVPKSILATVANSDDSMSFPWGTWAFLESLRIQSLGKDVVSEKKKLVKGGKTSNTLRYTSFLLPSSFLLFECINDFGETFGVKMEQTKPALPRMCLWKNKISKNPSHEAIINALNATKSVRSILLPEGSEIRAHWITSLTSLHSVSNPTLGEFIRGIQGRNSSSDEVHSSSEGSEVPSKKYVLRKRKVSKPCTPHGKAEHRPMLETQSPLLERTTNIKASSFSGNSSQNLPDSLKDYIDGKFSELQKTLCQEVENFLERKFQTLEERILLTLLDTSKGRTDEAKEDDGKKEEPVEVNEVDHSIFEGVDHNEEDEIKDGKEEDEKVEDPVEVNMAVPHCCEWVDHNEEAIKDGKEEEPMGVNMVDPYSFERVDHNEEDEIKDGKEEDEKVEDPVEVNMVDPPCFEWVDHNEEAIKDGKEEEPVGVNIVDSYSFEGVNHNEVEKKDGKEEDGKEEVGKEGDGKEEDEPIAVNMVKLSSFEGIPEEKEEEEGDQFKVKNRSPPIQQEEEEKFEVEGEANEDEMAMSDKIVHDVVEFCKSTENNVDEKLESDGDVLRELTNVDEVAAARSAIADGREVQCIMEKREESHDIVKKWWSSLIKAGGWLETSHMEEIVIYFMKMYNKKDSTYAVLLESFQMLSEVNATTELFPMLDTGLMEIVLGRWDSCSKPWKDISCVYWVHNTKDHWVAIRAEFDRKCLVVFDSLQQITSMSKLEEVQ
ncbi:unnamed protein product [Cuscuta campestris]|uniref:DUF1985 domain-containing protein n=1 Tax=Cuscuta campestris TaxID=132261 RepID=A0A484NBL8_9ASTE|nr:unnamed protein product [Cuscuta campestris]